MTSELDLQENEKGSPATLLHKFPADWSRVQARGLLQWREDLGGQREELLSLSSEHGVRRPIGLRGRAASLDLSKYRRVFPGDLVVNRLVARDGALAVSEKEGIVSPAYWVLRPNTEVLDSRYCHYLLRSRYSLDQISERSKFLPPAQFDILWQDFRSIIYPLPPLGVQILLGRYLDWANTRLEQAIRVKRKVIGLLNEQKLAIIHRAVTRGLDPSVALKPSVIPWLREIPKHWEVRRLRASIVDCVNGLWGSDPDGENDLTCVRVADFDRNNLRVTLKKKTIRSIPVPARRRRLLQAGDLLLEKSGGGEKQPVGAVVLYDTDEPAVCSNFVARLSIASGYHSGFLNYLHSALYALRMTVPSIKQTTGIQNLDSKSYLSERVAFPDQNEQEAISKYLDIESARFGKAIMHLEREIELLREYRTRLVADVVTGKLDVRDAAARLPNEVPLETGEGGADLGEDFDITDEEATA